MDVYRMLCVFSDTYDLNYINSNTYEFQSTNLICNYIDNILDKLINNCTNDLTEQEYNDNEYMDKCVICIENFVKNDMVTKLKCCHIFHKNCIIEWIKNKSICPVCRNKI